MSRPADFYEILALPHDCTREQIRAQYLALAKKHHPDVAKDKAQAHELFIDINKAYHTLYDVKMREAYDRKLHSTRSMRPPQAWAMPEQPKPQPPPKQAAPSYADRPVPDFASPSAPPNPNVSHPTRTGPLHDERFDQPGWNWKAGATRSAAEGARPTRPIGRPSPEPSAPAAPVPTAPTMEPILKPTGEPVSRPADLLRQARAELRRNQWNAAERLAMNFLAADPQSIEGLETLGDIHAASGRPREALKCYRRALKASPGNDILEAKVDCVRCTEAYPDPDNPPIPPAHVHEPAPEPPHRRQGWGGMGIPSWISDRFR